ncbi:MAG: GGDEF domain-containing protein [Caulobacteraceae bacterium]|nr:GGDEF domain-containing protein [Caulobacter sp.]
MAIDAPTMLLLTLAIAVIAAAFLAVDWRATRDPALASWSAGFAAIAVGCTLSPLRHMLSPLVGVWVANGLLIVAHLLFLRGVGLFVGRRTTILWWGVLLPWGVMLRVPIDAAHSGLFGLVNSILVGLVALWTGRLAMHGGDPAARRLGLVFLAHGLFYAVKAALIFTPGAFVDMLVLKGLLIQVSFFEGILVEVMLALLMAAAVRGRREARVAALAERDPLTGLLNRRAFAARTGALLDGTDGFRGMLLVIDVDHFKAVNDTAGHAAGDRLLVALAGVLAARMPEGGLAARLGGDEFVLAAPDLDGIELAVAAKAMRKDFRAAGERFLPTGLVATLSMGAVLARGGEPLDALLHRADEALYAAKRAGRDRLVSHMEPVRPAGPSPRLDADPIAVPVSGG